MYNSSYSRYTRKGINTHIKVCIHKYKYSYNCMYTHMSYMNSNYNYTYKSNFLYFISYKWNKNVKNYIPQHHY